MPLVSGIIYFEEEHQSELESVLLTVKLEDVSLMGMPSTIVASYSNRIDSVSDETVTFELNLGADSPEINPRSSYAVSAHVSLHPEDSPLEIRQGDYLTMQSYPVLTHGHPSVIRLKVKRIG